MNDFRGFHTHTEHDAPEAARPTMRAVLAARSFVPAAVARAALSPVALEAMLHGLHAFEKTSLGQLEREVVAMTMARANDCHVCRAMHTGILRAAGAEDETIEALREGTPLSDPRLRALSAFVHAVLRDRGDVAEPEWRAFLEAGFDREQALEVVLGVGAYTLSTFVNRLTAAPLDAPLQKLA